MTTNNRQPSDATLIDQSRHGDVESFGLLVDRHQTAVRGWLRVRMNNWANADDLAQDVFVTAFKRIQTYSGDGQFAAWLVGIARNHWRNYIRKQNVNTISDNEALVTLLDNYQHENPGTEQMMVEALRTCLEPLSTAARTLLEQRYIEGRTVRDLAAESGRGYSSLTMQLHRLRTTLATCIDEKIQPHGVQK